MKKISAAMLVILASIISSCSNGKCIVPATGLSVSNVETIPLLNVKKTTNYQIPVYNNTNNDIHGVTYTLLADGASLQPVTNAVNTATKVNNKKLLADIPSSNCSTIAAHSVCLVTISSDDVASMGV